MLPYTTYFFVFRLCLLLLVPWKQWSVWQPLMPRQEWAKLSKRWILFSYIIQQTYKFLTHLILDKASEHNPVKNFSDLNFLSVRKFLSQVTEGWRSITMLSMKAANYCLYLTSHTCNREPWQTMWPTPSYTSTQPPRRVWEKRLPPNSYLNQQRTRIYFH